MPCTKPQTTHRGLRVGGRPQSGVDLKPPQAAVVKSDGGERCGNVAVPWHASVSVVGSAACAVARPRSASRIGAFMSPAVVLRS